MVKKIRCSWLIFIYIFSLSACTGSTSLVESWYDETYQAQKAPDKVLVLGIFQDDIQRRVFESAFVEAVSTGGQQAIAGYTLMPETEDYDDKQEIIDAVDSTGVDRVLITHFKGVSKEQRYVPSTVDYMPTMAYPHYGAYYGTAYRSVYRPGYTVEDSIVSLETRVYSVDPEKLIWAGKTRSVNASSGEKISQELVNILTDDMKAKGLIE